MEVALRYKLLTLLTLLALLTQLTLLTLFTQLKLLFTAETCMPIRLQRDQEFSIPGFPGQDFAKSRDFLGRD